MSVGIDEFIMLMSCIPNHRSAKRGEVMSWQGDMKNLHDKAKVLGVDLTELEGEYQQ